MKQGYFRFTALLIRRGSFWISWWLLFSRSGSRFGGKNRAELHQGGVCVDGCSFLLCSVDWETNSPGQRGFFW